MKIIPAVCPNCNSNLIGVSNYNNFFCKSCKQNFILKGDKLSKREVIFAKYKIENQNLFYLIFKIYKVILQSNNNYFKYQNHRLIPDAQKRYINFIVPNFIIKTIDNFFRLNPFNLKLKEHDNIYACICFGGIKETICLNTLKVFAFTSLLQSGNKLNYDDLYISIQEEKELALPFKLEHNYLISENFKFSVEIKSIIHLDKFISSLERSNE